jgi:hypothetical protein
VARIKQDVARTQAGAKIAAFLVAAATAASAPLLPGRNQTAAGDLHFAGWPLAYEGRALTEMPLTQREIAMARDFPGRIGRFSDGKREIVMRWVGVPTRRLHSAADCLRGIGYSITPLPARRDAGGHAMGCLRASHGADVMTVCDPRCAWSCFPGCIGLVLECTLRRNSGAVVVLRGIGRTMSFADRIFQMRYGKHAALSATNS